MTVEEKKIFLHGRNRDFTGEEFDELSDMMGEALMRGDKEEVRRIGRIIPANPITAMAFKQVYGKEWLINTGADLTEATLYWGEGWLDEPDEEDYSFIRGR